MRFRSATTPHDCFLHNATVKPDNQQTWRPSVWGLGHWVQWARSSSRGSITESPRSSASRIVMNFLVFFPSMPSGRPTTHILWSFKRDIRSSTLAFSAKFFSSILQFHLKSVNIVLFGRYILRDQIPSRWWSLLVLSELHQSIRLKSRLVTERYLDMQQTTKSCFFRIFQAPWLETRL